MKMKHPIAWMTLFAMLLVFGIAEEAEVNDGLVVESAEETLVETNEAMIEADMPVNIESENIEVILVDDVTDEEDHFQPEVQFKVEGTLQTNAVVENNGIEWSMKDGVLTIWGEGPMDKTLWSSEVEQLAIRKVIIEDGVTSIDDKAFYGCMNLTGIAIPDSVTSIGDSAFHACTNLTGIEIPNSVTQIGDNAFGNCRFLSTAIEIPDGVTKIGNSVFAGCESLKSVTIPDSVTRIGYLAFSCCGSLTDIKIPDSVTDIGYRAFEYCNSLTGITIPGGVTNIEMGVFEECKNLTEITILGSVVSIGNYAFYNCAKLKSIALPDSVTQIGSSAFENCESLTSIGIPDGVTYISGYAFSGCKNLTSIRIPGGVTNIWSGTFKDCKRLIDIMIPDSVTRIDDSAFYNCTGLKSIVLPDNLMKIGKNAFEACESLTDIRIPDGVISIGEYTFIECISLTEITIPDSVISIGKSAFESCNQLTDVYYQGTSVKAAEIKNNGGNEDLFNAVWHYVEKPTPKPTPTPTPKPTHVPTPTPTPVPVIKPTSVKIDALGTLEPGAVVQLTAELFPTGSTSLLKWTSSNPKIAAVSADGLLTVKKEGTVTITVRTANKKSAAVKAKVVDPHKPGGVSVPEKSKELSLGKLFEENEKYTIVPVITPATAEPYAKLTYKSSDTKVVTVDENGIVTAKGVGSAAITVTATYTANAKIKKIATMKVMVSDPFALSTVALNEKDTVQLSMKETLELVTNITPEGAECTTKWSTSDKKIATVDGNGLVTPVKTGTVTITATVKRGRVIKKAIVKVTVFNPELPGKVFIEPVANTKIKVGTGIDLSATVMPDTAIVTSLTWKSSDTKIATVDANGHVTAKKAGNVTITATAKNGKNGKSGTIKLTVVK